MKLWKMHGAGNDFLLTDNRKLMLKNKNEFTKRICDRHFGVGADGFIALENSAVADIKMSFFNADGTEDTMCGNGIRCITKFARDIGAVSDTEITVETGDGIKRVKVISETHDISSILVDMGTYSFLSKDIGVDCDKETFIEEKLVMKDGREFIISCVRLGVNHGVIYVDDDRDYPLLYGKEIEEQPIFMKDMNVNFVRYIDETHLEVKTWERGVGKTLACGTGCSSSALITSKLKKIGDKINVKAPGGNLVISINNGSVFMEGPAQKVAEVEIDNN